MWTPQPYGRIHSFLATPPGPGPWPTLFLLHGGPFLHDRDSYDPRVELLTDASAVVALAVAGVASTVTNVLVITVVQQHTAAHLLGRVMSAILFAALGLFPLSGAAAGLVVDAHGSGVLFLATAATLGAAFAFGLSRRSLRDG
ncbi:hypothetical protein MCAG_00640 [Micromonospora sp. ATCC 39149]|nr:hypothetical protein [Micromonospora sp. ATCC 39149]EEP70313.1 hypothetical protein MCAG_00640 [Micromonospora sp. ATCC 39149]